MCVWGLITRVGCEVDACAPFLSLIPKFYFFQTFIPNICTDVYPKIHARIHTSTRYLSWHICSPRHGKNVVAGRLFHS